MEMFCFEFRVTAVHRIVSLNYVALIGKLGKTFHIIPPYKEIRLKREPEYLHLDGIWLRNMI
jgi:hypothetical protein